MTLIRSSLYLWLVIGPTLLSVANSSATQVSTVNEMRLTEMNSDSTKNRNTNVSTAQVTARLKNSSSVPRLTRNVTYCDVEPKFRLGSGSLLTFLLRLKLCEVVAGKPWFEKSCIERIYNITDYYSAVYVKFCEPVNFQNQCGNTGSVDEVVEIVQSWMRRNNVSEFNKTNEWTQPYYNYSSVMNNLSAINDYHCKEINSFFNIFKADDNTETDYNSTTDFFHPFYNVPYTEWFLAYRAFCEPAACGVSKSLYENYSLSAYDCFPLDCRPAIVFIMAFDSILALVVVVANALVLAVAARSTIMRNIPGYFKISLAVADLMIGVFVLPGSVYHHYVLSIVPLPYRNEGQSPRATDYFSQRYLDFMGIFTVLSFTVSLYTMGAASVDRYLAVTKPFRYKKGKYLTKKRSVVVFALIWLVGLVCAVYPVFTAHPYNISALGLILSTGFVAIVVYAATLGLPLIAVWVINGAMLRQVCAEGKQRRTLSGVRRLASHTNSAPKEETSGKKQSLTKNGTSPNGRKNSSLSDDDVFDSDKPIHDNRKQSTESKGYRNFSNKSRLSTITSSWHSQLKKRLSHTSSNSLNNQVNVEKKLAKTLAVMIGAFTIAILPCIIVLAVQTALMLFISPRSYPKTYSPHAMNVYTTSEYFASRLLLSNSFWNCVIYSIRNKHFRRALTGVFICDEEKRRRHKVSSLRGSHGSKLSKMASTDSGCVATGCEKRKDARGRDLSRKSSGNNKEKR